MIVSEKAYEKARDKEENTKAFFLCLQHHICPKCAGDKIEKHEDAKGLKFIDIYKCLDCGAVIDIS